jgi:hypothetical protein
MPLTWRVTWNSGLGNPANVWMAAPDIIAFSVSDPPIIPGNFETGTFSGNAYDTWFLRNNPIGGASEYCTPIGINRTEVRYSDKPNPAGYINRMALRTQANYSITGAGQTISAVYYRDEANGQGETAGTGQNLMITSLHTVYLKLTGLPTQGSTITITNTTAGIDPLVFVYNDKVTRAGGIQINQAGMRADDALKYGYLAARIPGGANNGTVNFASTYGLTSFQILDASKGTVFTGSIVQRVSSAATTGEGYDSGLDIADWGQGWTITAINKATNTVTCPGHGLAPTDKVRFLGVNGLTVSNAPALESPPSALAGSLWIAPTVTAVSGDDVTISAAMSGFAGTFNPAPAYSTALGGVSNKIFKCFNTNRAGTYVYGLDFSSWTPSADGIYYVYIPGYGISDPIHIDTDIWKKTAATFHEGTYNLRLGMAVSASNGYSRGVALADGVNGCLNYESKLVAMFSSEGASAIVPTGMLSSDAMVSGLGAYFDAGTLMLSGLTCSGTTATATTITPHGITVGRAFCMQTRGCTPAGYNLLANDIIGANHATATGASTFTYPVASTLATASVAGYARTGQITTVRTGGRPGHQDAGDNDDLAVDHYPGWKTLAMVFRNLPKPARFTPFTVPLSSAVLNPALFPPGPNTSGGTDDLPPLFHEMFWYSEAYRLTQEADGSIWGGYGVGHFTAQVANYPETIDKYRGTDAGGNLLGQTVMGFAYARDHFTTFLYAGYAAQLAQIAYDYSLTTLGDTYKASAIAAYAWADTLAVSPTVNDAYYKGVLDLKNKAQWTEAQYQNVMYQLNGWNGAALGRAILAKFDAAGSLYRLLGATSGQTPYGNFIEQSMCYLAPTATIGSGYAVGDIITLTTGTGGTGTYTNPVRILVTTVDGSGGITGRVIMNTGQYTVTPTNPVAQNSTTGAGSGATFTLTFIGLYTQVKNTIGDSEYAMTPGNNATVKNRFRTTYENTLATVGLASTLPYQGMYLGLSGANTSGGMIMGFATQALVAHMHYVGVSGVNSTTAASPYLKVMQAQCAFTMGANLANKAYVTGVGPRPYKCMLHEESYRYGKPAPPGFSPFGHFSWASSNMHNNFSGSTAGADGPANWIADNVTGTYESNPTPGSAKMWTPWRGASSYWEWAPENCGIIFNSEFVQVSQLYSIAVQLYLHGWDK